MEQISGKLVVCNSCDTTQVIHFRDTECLFCGAENLRFLIPEDAENETIRTINF